MKKPKSDESPKLKKCASNLQSEILKKRINKKGKEEKNITKKIGINLFLNFLFFDNIA